MLSILDLNDDCLFEIFNLLSIYELIEAEKVCKAFKAVCGNVYKSKRFFKIKFSLHHLKTEYLKNIFDRVGHSLRSFEFSGGYIMNEDTKRTIIDEVTNSCPQLRSLTLNYVLFNNKLFEQLLKSFNNLTSLDLSRCNINESMLKTTVDVEISKKIYILKLAGNTEMNGSFFKNMVNVEYLDISYCFNLNYIEFLGFLRNCLKLVDLDVSACCQLVSDNENFLEELLHHQPNIERLNMDSTGITKGVEVLSRFKNLKYCSFEEKRFGT